MSKDNVTRRISIFINDKEVENSLKSVEGAMSHVRNQMRLLNRDSADYDQQSKELAATMSQLRERQSAFREELGFTNTELQKTGDVAGGLRGSLSGIWDSLVSGDMQGAKEGISGIASGLGGMVKSSLAFIATPIGAAVAALAGVAAGAKAMFDFNVNAEKSAQLIENLSGKTGQVVEDIRVKMQAMTDTFDVSFEQLAGAVDNLVDTGVAKNELEALDKIKNGLLTAPDKNEFITSLESSAVTAKQVGLDLEEVIALKKSIEETGVNPEATFGALEKAGKNLALQTDKLRSGLTEAFGAAFTDDILAKVKTGQLSTVQALDLINKKSKEVGLNQTQQAEIGAQLFGKAAQSAGGFATVLDTVSGGLAKQKEEYNINQKALDELSIANEKLGKAQSELFRVQNFGELWTKIKSAAIDALAGMITYISDLKKDIQPLIDVIGVAFVIAWELLKETVLTVFDIVSGVIKIFFNNIKAGVDIIKKIFSGDFKGAISLIQDYFVSLNNTVQNIFGKIKNNIINAVQGIVKAVSPVLEALGFDVDKINKKLESFKSKEVKITTSSETTGNSQNPEAANTKSVQEELDKQKAIRDAARQKELDAQQKAIDKKKADAEKEIEDARVLAEQKKKLFDTAEREIDNLILKSAEDRRINALKGLEKEIAAVELKYAKEIEKYKEHSGRLKELEALRAQEISDLKTAKELEYGAKILEIDGEISLSKELARFDREANEATSAEERQLILIEKARFLADEEIAADLDKELKKVENVANAELLKDAIKLQSGQKKAEMDLQFDAAEKAIKSQQVDWTKMTEDQKLNSVKSALNGASEALNKGSAAWKAVKIAETTIATYQSAVNSYNSLSGIAVVGPVLGAVAAAAAVASGIMQIKKISSTKIETAPKFFQGGSTGSNPSLGYDEYGPVTGYVHKNEYVIPEVMTQDPRFANTIGWLEHNRQQKLRGYVDGGATSTGTVPNTNVNTISNDTAMLAGAINTLNNILASGIIAKLNLGYNDIKNMEDMKDEINQSTQNGTIS